MSVNLAWFGFLGTHQELARKRYTSSTKCPYCSRMVVLQRDAKHHRNFGLPLNDSLGNYYTLSWHFKPGTIRKCIGSGVHPAFSPR
jgi:hypothetical protein